MLQLSALTTMPCWLHPNLDTNLLSLCMVREKDKKAEYMKVIQLKKIALEMAIGSIDKAYWVLMTYWWLFYAKSCYIYVYIYIYIGIIQ